MREADPIRGWRPWTSGISSGGSTRVAMWTLCKDAVVFKDERITYQELRDRSYRLADALSSLGVIKGDRVAVLLRNCSEWFDIFFAVASLGAVMVPVNFLLKPKEVEFIVRDSGSKLLLVGQDLLPLVDPSSKETPELANVICIGQVDPPTPVLSYADLMKTQEANPPDGHPPQADDLFLLQYTSGTTGFPKGAMHTQGTILWNSFHQIGDFTVTEKDRYLCVPGLCWAAGFHDFVLAALWMGGTVVVVPSGGLEIGSLLEIIQEERITKVLLVPSILKQVVDYPDFKKFDLSSLEFVASGAAPVPVTVYRAIQRTPSRKHPRAGIRAFGGPHHRYMSQQAGRHPEDRLCGKTGYQLRGPDRGRIREPRSPGDQGGDHPPKPRYDEGVLEPAGDEPGRLCGGLVAYG